MKKILISFLLIALVLAGFKVAAAATTGQGLTISPPLSELKFEPGKSYHQTIKINNPTQDVVTFYPVARNFSASGETGVPAIESPGSDATYGLASWISFSQTKIALTPQQETEFKYTITVPNNAEPGGHYAAVLFASEPPKADDTSTQVSLASMVGSLILGSVSGNVIEKGQVVEFSSNGRFFAKFPVDFILRIQNSGNVHFSPKGEVTVSNWGKKVSSQDMNPQKGNILPNSIRKFDDLKYAGKWYDFGKFTVRLSANYGDGSLPLTGSFSFWLIPWWLIVAVLLVIVIIILTIVRRRRGRKRSAKYSYSAKLPEEPHKKRIVLQ
jgi:hypothetical protein